MSGINKACVICLRIFIIAKHKSVTIMCCDVFMSRGFSYTGLLINKVNVRVPTDVG